MEKVKLSFAGLEIQFIDRDKALKQVEELAEKGTFPVYVIYGPEGCGKTAWLRQAMEILEKEFGYHVIYANPLSEEVGEALRFTPSIKDIVKEVLNTFPDPFSKIVNVAIRIASFVMKRMGRSRIAVLMDDIFQAVGVDKAEIYVKTLLNLIEYPPASYERIVVLVTSSEGVTRERVGRHNWATLYTLWNMPKKGFEELYNAIPNRKPSFEDVWKATGGNPRYLEELFKAKWSIDRAVEQIALRKSITHAFVRRWREHLEKAIEDPDYLWYGPEEVETLARELIEKNLIIYHLPPRNHDYWIDEPPPEKDLELGIGRYVAWQTPLHREAIRRALQRS